MESNLQIFLKFWLLVISTSFSTEVKIQFYQNSNFTGLIYETSSSEKCINFHDNPIVILSFTTDTCLIQYKHRNCQSSESSKILPGNYSAPFGVHYPFPSFHSCNEEEGGFQLNIDITNYFDKGKSTHVPEALVTYRQVCSCTNIPDFILEMDKWSINNHANEFIGYYEPDCLENNLKGTRFRPGQYDDVRNIYNLTKMDNVTGNEYKIWSFGPSKNTTYFVESNCQDKIMLTKLIKRVAILEQSILHVQNYQEQKNGDKNLEKYDTEINSRVNSLEHQNQVLKSKLSEWRNLFKSRNSSWIES